VAFQQGFFTIARTCGACGGLGLRITKKCATCSGEGRLRTERTITVRIPPGVDDGMQLRVSGEGEVSGEGGAAGDLYVALHVRPHPRFTRQGKDLLSTAEISFAQAALGAEIRVPTPDGDHAVQIVPGTQSGSRMRLRGKGAPALDGTGRGDLHIDVQVRTPSRLSGEERALFERLAELEGAREEDRDRGLFDRVKDIFG
jgi:molecular chaperone DnaJ